MRPITRNHALAAMDALQPFVTEIGGRKGMVSKPSEDIVKTVVHPPRARERAQLRLQTQHELSFAMESKPDDIRVALMQVLKSSGEPIHLKSSHPHALFSLVVADKGKNSIAEVTNVSLLAGTKTIQLREGDVVGLSSSDPLIALAGTADNAHQQLAASRIHSMMLADVDPSEPIDNQASWGEEHDLEELGLIREIDRKGRHHWQDITALGALMKTRMLGVHIMQR